MRENCILAPSERHGSLMGEPAIGGKSRGSHGRGITRESTTTGVNKYALRACAAGAAHVRNLRNFPLIIQRDSCMTLDLRQKMISARK